MSPFQLTPPHRLKLACLEAARRARGTGASTPLAKMLSTNVRSLVKGSRSRAFVNKSAWLLSAQGSIRVWTSSFLRGARRAKSEGLYEGQGQVHHAPDIVERSTIKPKSALTSTIGKVSEQPAVRGLERASSRLPPVDLSSTSTVDL